MVKGSDPEQFVIVEYASDDPSPTTPPINIRGPFSEPEFRATLRAGGLSDSYIDAIIPIVRNNPISLG